MAEVPRLRLDLQPASTESPLPSGNRLRQWAEAALLRPGPYEVTIRLVDDAESARLNSDYRGKSGATNVLAFPTEPPPELPAELHGEGSLPLLGDLVICAPLVRQEADVQGKPLDWHWAHLVVHGMLHLQGYDHLDDRQAEEMEGLERQILATQGIPDPYD